MQGWIVDVLGGPDRIHRHQVHPRGRFHQGDAAGHQLGSSGIQAQGPVHLGEVAEIEETHRAHFLGIGHQSAVNGLLADEGVVVIDDGLGQGGDGLVHAPALGGGGEDHGLRLRGPDQASPEQQHQQEEKSKRLGHGTS